MPPKKTPLRQNNNNIDSIKRNSNAPSQSTRKKNVEDTNIANIVNSLSTGEKESFIEINDDLESCNDVFSKRKELSEDLDFEITKKPKTVPGFYKHHLALLLCFYIVIFIIYLNCKHV